MLRTVSLVVVLAAVCWGQEPTTHKQLHSVKFDEETHKLTWIVSKGRMVEGKYQPEVMKDYEIDLDNATMTVAGETRKFAREEAVGVLQHFHLAAQYVKESVDW